MAPGPGLGGRHGFVDAAKIGPVAGGRIEERILVSQGAAADLEEVETARFGMEFEQGHANSRGTVAHAGQRRRGRVGAAGNFRVPGPGFS